MKKTWEEEARKYNVYPLYDNVGGRVADVKQRFAPQSDRFEFYKVTVTLDDTADTR